VLIEVILAAILVQWRVEPPLHAVNLHRSCRRGSRVKRR
jgi:hypothetical protein